MTNGLIGPYHPHDHVAVVALTHDQAVEVCEDLARRHEGVYFVPVPIGCELSALRGSDFVQVLVLTDAVPAAEGDIEAATLAWWEELEGLGSREARAEGLFVVLMRSPPETPALLEMLNKVREQGVARPIIIDSASFDRVTHLIENPPAPTEAMLALFGKTTLDN